MNYNVAAIVGSRHHNEDIIRVYHQPSMLIAVKLLATVRTRPSEAHWHEARLHALQWYPNTRSDGNIVTVSCRIAVQVVQQTLADLRPHGFSTALSEGS